MCYEIWQDEINILSGLIYYKKIKIVSDYVNHLDSLKTQKRLLEHFY